MGFPTAVTRASTAWAAINAIWNVWKLLKKRPPEVELQKTPYRPPQWTPSAQTSIIEAGGTVHVFDAILKTNHTTSLRITEHPVQNGANIADHSYVLPERVVLEIGMSDVMDSYQPDRWKEYSTKSISAFQKLKELQYKRQPVIVETRLNFYENMVIENIQTPDDYKTIEGLRCSVTFKQIISAQVKVVRVSSRPQTSGQSKKGVKQPKPMTAELGSALSEMGL
jgi:hypothetical protein